MEVHRPVIRIADETHGEVDPDVLAVLSRVPLLDAPAFLFPGEHRAHRLVQRRDVVGMSDVEQRQGPQLGIAVPDELAERRVHRGDVAVEARERHAGLCLLEQSAEARLGLAFAGLGAAPLRDIADERQELIAPRRDAVDRNLDLDSPPRLGDERGGIARRHLSARQPVRQVDRQDHGVEEPLRDLRRGARPERGARTDCSALWMR